MALQKAHCQYLSVTVLVAALASFILFWVTTNGIGVSPDSTIYIETARNLLAGKGFYEVRDPMTQYPPVYPILLAMSGFLGSDIVGTGRLLHVFLYAANAVLFGLSVYICTRRNLVATICAFLIYFSSGTILSVHSYAYSEAPFIMFLLGAFILFSLHIASPRLILILMASCLLSLAITTRYVGITLLPPILFGIFYFENRSVRHKIKDILIVISFASVPITAWLIRNILVAQTATNRGFSVHPIGIYHLKTLITTLHNFVFPGNIPVQVGVLDLMVLAFAYFGAMAVMYRLGRIKPHSDSVGMIFSSLSIVFSLVYIAFILISISFFDAATPLSGRICLPVFMVMASAAISLTWSLSYALQKPIIHRIFILFVLFSAGYNGIYAAEKAADMHSNGIGYNSREWNESMTLSEVNSFGRDLIIYSNGPDIIQFKTGRDAIWIAGQINAITRDENLKYQEQLQAMCRDCAESRAILVYFSNIKRWYVPTENEIKLNCDLHILSRSEDGTIYGGIGKKTVQ
jgi:hypothetical protein